MPFLIGVILLILFVLILYFYFRVRIQKFLRQFGLSAQNIGDIIEEARLEDQELPKSLSSMDRIFEKQVLTDFPDMNIQELKKKSEKEILDFFQAIERGDSSSLSGKIKSAAESMIMDFQGKNISFQQFRFHNTVLSNYHKNKNIATLSFSSAFEYYQNENGHSVKCQDRARVEYIYVIDETAIADSVKAIGIHCPNCGSPIKTLGEKHCSYCGSAILEVVGRVFVCNDIVRY